MGKFKISEFKVDLRDLIADLGKRKSLEEKRNWVTDYAFTWDHGRVLLVVSNEILFLVTEDTEDSRDILRSEEARKLIGIIFNEIYLYEATEYTPHFGNGYITWEIK